MTLSKIDTAAIAADAIEASQLASTAISTGDLPSDTGVIQRVSTLTYNTSSWNVASNNWYNYPASTTITPTAAGNIIMVITNAVVPAEAANNGNMNRYRTQYGSNYFVDCSDAWNYSDPATHVNKNVSRTSVATFVVAAGEVGTAQTVRPQWSPDGGGTYKIGAYFGAGHANCTLTVLEIRG